MALPVGLSRWRSLVGRIGAYWKGGTREPITAPAASGGVIKIRSILELVGMISIDELSDLLDQVVSQIKVLAVRMDSLERQLGDLSDSLSEHLDRLTL